MTTTERAQAQGALRGVQVLDFGQYIPGPMLGMLLSDQGADVIKVERPGGDPARNEPAFATWNRGKRSVVLDLKTPEGQAAAQALAKKADIVIENYRPGVADRLGIGYQTLTKDNPRLLYVSIPGFGEDSPTATSAAGRASYLPRPGPISRMTTPKSPCSCRCPRPAPSPLSWLRYR